MTQDWRSGSCAGGAFALVENGKVVYCADSRAQLVKIWEKVVERAGMPGAPFPDDRVREIVYVIPPWAKP